MLPHEQLDLIIQNLLIYGVSRPDGRSAKVAYQGGEESPGSMEARCRIISGGGDPRDSATESKPPAEALEAKVGKGERVR